MITAHANAPQGSVAKLPFYRPSDFPASAAILCRNSAPLLGFAFALLRRNVACHVLGRDIAAGLERLLDKVAGDSPVETQQRLAAYATAESRRLESRNKFQEASNVRDRCACLALFLGEPTLSAARWRITSLFKSGPGITLSTIHKAKGLEWETVFLLDRDALQPSRWARAPWEQQQEQNLLYVAVTRAKLNLFYIKSGCWKD